MAEILSANRAQSGLVKKAEGAISADHPMAAHVSHHSLRLEIEAYRALKDAHCIFIRLQKRWVGRYGAKGA